MLGLPTGRILAWTRSGLLAPTRGPRGAYLFSFQDIVLLRTARELLDAAVPARRVREALGALRSQLPPGRPLSALDISAAGYHILVSDGDRQWEADSGQLRLGFDAGESGEPVTGTSERAAPFVDRVSLPTPSVPPKRVGSPSRVEPTADDWYDAALDLEATSVAGAVAAYRKALEVEPHHPEAHLNLGRLLHESGELAQAEQHYRAAGAADPGAARAHYNLGVVLEDTGREAEAIGAYREALRLDENLATAHFNLARLCESRGLEVEALGHLAAYRRLLGRGAPTA